MNVKAIIHEVFVELSSKGTLLEVQEPPDEFFAVRRHYLDSYLSEYNGRRRPVMSKGRKAGDSEGARFQVLSPEIATEKTP